MESSYSRYASILPPSNKNILHFKTNYVLLSYNKEITRNRRYALRIHLAVIF